MLRLKPDVTKTAACLLACLTMTLAVTLASCAKPAPDPVLPPPVAVTKPGTTLRADPDPVVPDDGGSLGETSIVWSTTAPHTELHINAPNGTLFGRGGASGSARTGKWVTDGMVFYLQDADNPNPGSAEATLGSLAVAVRESL
jgi:hypothetical protein